MTPSGPAEAVRGVVFDLGGVVYRTPFEHVPWVEERLGLPPGSIPRGPFGPPGDRDFEALDAGEIGDAEYWRRVAARLPGAGQGRDLDIHRALAERHETRPVVVEALRRIHARYRTGVLTNDATDWIGPGWRERWELAPLFDAIVDAADVQVGKPDPAIYRLAADALGLTVEACLFVDDLRGNVEGARRAGMHGFRFDVRRPGESAAALLATLGLEPQVPGTVRG